MIVAILQARASSSRLPNKVLKPILGKPMLLRQVERIKRSLKSDRLVVATSQEHSDDVIERLCLENGIDCFRGSLNDVLDRFYNAATKYEATHIVRLTGDCPLIDPQIIDQVINTHIKLGSDYTSNTLEPSYPDGLDIEVFSFHVLKQAWKEARLPSEREHVTPFIHSQPKRFTLSSVKNSSNLSSLRWTVDVIEDFEFVTQIYDSLYPSNPTFLTSDILTLLDAHPEFISKNSHYKRNEGMKMSLEKDRFAKRYQKSNEALSQALKTIPLGTQTFSKSKIQYPDGVSPSFIQRGQGSHVWDVDGNEYVDFVSSLCAITLGYNDPDVTKAVREQLEDGVIFSLAHPIEVAVAEKLCEMVPCAEMVRFGKNGSDATSGAVRLARAYTNREHVAVCGYHGWQDWYIGSTQRNRGVPQATRDLTHTFSYNNLDSLKKLFDQYPENIAAVILEPMNTTQPEKGFLEGIAELTHKKGALLVFDEMITGFRFANGGAQEFFGVTPDLATFGKGMANGYPISAIVGKADIMRLMEEIFFSFTFGGETLSLAASLATMNKCTREPVIQKIHAQGEKIMTGVSQLIKKHSLEDVISLMGSAPWSFLIFKDTKRYTQWQIKTLFLQEMFIRGILTFGTHNMSYSHSDEDVHKLLGAYDEVFSLLHEVTDQGTLKEKLFTKPLEPLFKVR